MFPLVVSSKFLLVLLNELGWHNVILRVSLLDSTCIFGHREKIDWLLHLLLLRFDTFLFSFRIFNINLLLRMFFLGWLLYLLL